MTTTTDPITTIEALRRSVRRVTYVPGSRLTVYSQRGRPLIRIQVPVRRVRPPHKLVDVEQSVEVPLPISEKNLHRLIYDRCKSIALHELCEWFRVDDLCLVDPHPEVKGYGTTPHTRPHREPFVNRVRNDPPSVHICGLNCVPDCPFLARRS